MMRFHSLFVAAAWLSATALAVEAPVNFSGTWVLDASRSDPGLGGMWGGGRGRGIPAGRGRAEHGRRSPGGEAPGGEREGRASMSTLVIDQTVKELRLTRKFDIGGEERTSMQILDLEGGTSTNPVAMGRGELKTRSSWDKAKLVTKGIQTVTTPYGEMVVTVEEELSLSEDGNELTLKIVSTTPRGEMTSKQVFTRK